MNKKTNKFISNWVFPIIGVGGLIFSLYLSKKLTFIPDLSFCYSYPIILCDIPIIRFFFKILDARIIIGLAIYAFIFFFMYKILKKLGFKELDEK